MLASLEKFQSEAEERGNAFLLTALEKHHMRLKAMFERQVVRILVACIQVASDLCGTE